MRNIQARRQRSISTTAFCGVRRACATLNCCAQIIIFIGRIQFVTATDPDQFLTGFYLLEKLEVVVTGDTEHVGYAGLLEAPNEKLPDRLLE